MERVPMDFTFALHADVHGCQVLATNDSISIGRRFAFTSAAPSKRRPKRLISPKGLARIKAQGSVIKSHSSPHHVLRIAHLSQFGLTIHQNDHPARRRFVEWAQNEIAVVPDFHKRILFSDEAHFWLNGYVNKQNCRIWSEANPQVYVETPLHPEKLTVWCALWAGGILLQKR
ncbi:hypothetical protein TNCV_2623021 [Trichonephila clavipes]|nr:hypothetical protein TNCV_2623021 [Trichonephila clavipes]